MSEKIFAALFTFAFLAALAAWVPLIEAAGGLLVPAKRRRRKAQLLAGTLLSEAPC